MNSTPKAAAGPAQEFSIRVPKNTKKRHNVMRFTSTLNVDFTKWAQVKMERENNLREYKGQDEDTPKFGAGSEFGRDAREEARKKKYGIISRKYKPEDQPWILKAGGKTGKKFRGIKEGGISQYASYYIFTHAQDGAIEAFPLNEWFNFQPIQRYKTLSAEEAEAEFAHRNNVMNYFSLMIRKKLKNDEEGEEDEELKEDGKGKKGNKKSKEFVISEMDEWMESDDDSSDSEDGENKKNSDDEDGKKNKNTKKSDAKKKKNKKKKKDDFEDDDHAFEESDDGDEEGRECDYMSESSESGSDLEKKKEIKSVAEEDALRKLLVSDEEDDDDDEEKEKKEFDEDKNEEDGNKETDKEKDKSTKDGEKRKDKKKKKKSIQKKDAKKSAPGKDSSSDFSSDSDSDSDVPKEKEKDKKTNSAHSSRSTTPTPAASTSDLLKRKNNASPDLSQPKKMKLDNYTSVSTPFTPSSSESGITEEAVRRYLMRKPMTTTELLQKFKSKKTGLTSEQLVNTMTGILKRINPTKQTIKNKILKGKIIAIRREDQSVWERRAALAPANVRRLVRSGVKVIIQPSNRRAYPVQSYLSAGAVLQEDISSASVIFGVKQVPVDQLIPNKTYCFFSHTIKAQESNMPLLDAILEKNIRLIDYEKLTDDNGQRIVAFGKYAGVAGMVNILHGLGLRLLALGHHTPFMHIGPAHNYRDSSMARQSIRDAGYEVALGALPKSIGPLTVVFTGSGNVSQGAQEVFQELPHEYVAPEALRKVAEHGDTNKIYACQVRRRHHLERKEDGVFDPEEYDQHPERYISTFSKKIAPYASIIINGIYWAVDSPKLLTIPDAKYLLRPANTPWLPISVGAPALPHRMLAICDVSADPGGSIEFMNECTTIDTPFCLYDADRNKDTKSFKGPGVLVCSIDNMPTQLPRESTDFFGDLLFPHLLDIMQSDAKKSLDEHNFTSAVHGAIIASNGKLTPNFEYIRELRQLNSKSRHKACIDNGSEQSKKVVVLGAGYVSAPVVEYLHRDKNVGIVVCSQLKDEADALANKYPGVEPVFLNVLERSDTLLDVVSSADVVVSLLPYSLHHVIAKACIETKTHLVTASYMNDDVKALHNEAETAGVTILNEVGLDPGIDHLLALECFEGVRQGGGKIESFVSWCGGLPAPECSDNPLRYKFSWSPRGVLLNTLSSAKYFHEGQIVEITGGGDLMSAVQDLDFLPGFALEGFPNRDSTNYRDLYGIQNAETILRGTLRFKGFTETIQALQFLGLIDPNPNPILHPNGPEITWRSLICNFLGLPNESIFYENLKRKLIERVNSEERVKAIEDLGLLEEDLVLKLNTPLDTLSHYLSKKLKFEHNERDLVILRHDIGIRWPDGKRELRGVNMVIYGDPKGHSAMARTVGFPAAIAVKMILDGEIQQRGNVLPFTPDIYRPLLSRLRAEGLESFETSKWL